MASFLTLLSSKNWLSSSYLNKLHTMIIYQYLTVHELSINSVQQRNVPGPLSKTHKGPKFFYNIYIIRKYDQNCV